MREAGSEEQGARTGSSGLEGDRRCACVVGATGMVGRALTQQLLDDPDYEEVRLFLRREADLSHPKLKQFVVDFERPRGFQEELVGEVLFSCLGTTLKAAGSQEKQYRIDHDLNLTLAEIASRNGVPAYVLLSSKGANPASRMFYLRMKGELERDASLLPFQSSRYLRPGMLDGDRQEDRPMEALGLRMTRWLPRWSAFAEIRPVQAQVVAQAMRAAASDWSPGALVVEHQQILVLGGASELK